MQFFVVQSKEMDEKDLTCQLFLLEPDWLASQVSQQLLRSQSNDLVPTERGSSGLRDLMNMMAKIQVQERPSQNNSEEAEKENSAMDVNENCYQGRAPPRNQYGETAFHVAARTGNLAKLRTALEKYPHPRHLKMADFNGWTALHEACNHGRVEIVKELLLHIKDPQILLCLGGEEQVTACHEAQHVGHEHIVGLLLEHHRKIGGLEQALKGLPDRYATSLVEANHDQQQFSVIITKNHVLASMSIYKYVLSYGLVELKEILKSKAVDKKGKHLHPLNRNLELAPHYQPFLRSKLCVFPAQRTDLIKAEDVRTYWKGFGKKIIYTFGCIENKKCQ